MTGFTKREVPEDLKRSELPVIKKVIIEMLETQKNRNESFTIEKKALEDEMKNFAVKVADDVFNRQTAQRKKRETPLITLESILADAKVEIVTYEGVPVEQVEEDAEICEWIDGSPDHSYIVAEAIAPEIRIKGKIVRRAKLSCYKKHEKTVESAIPDKDDKSDTANTEVVITDEKSQPDSISTDKALTGSVEMANEISEKAVQSEPTVDRENETGEIIIPSPEKDEKQQEEKINGSEKCEQEDKKNIETPTDSADVTEDPAVVNKPEKPGFFSWLKQIFSGHSGFNTKRKEEINIPGLTVDTQKNETLAEKDEKAAETVTETIRTDMTSVVDSGNIKSENPEETANIKGWKDDAEKPSKDGDAVQKDEAPADDSVPVGTENPEEAVKIDDRKGKSEKTEKVEDAVQKDETPGEDFEKIETDKPKQAESAESRKEGSEKTMIDEDAIQIDITPVDNSINSDASELDEAKDAEQQNKEIEQIAVTEKETIHTESTSGEASPSDDNSSMKHEAKKAFAQQSRKQKKKVKKQNSSKQ